MNLDECVALVIFSEVGVTIMVRGIFADLNSNPRKDVQTVSKLTEEKPPPSLKYPGRKSRNNPGWFGCMGVLVASILTYLLVGGSDMTVMEFMKEQARSWYNHYKNTESFKTTLPSGVENF